jgi:hypothetical protein
MSVAGQEFEDPVSYIGPIGQHRSQSHVGVWVKGIALAQVAVIDGLEIAISAQMVLFDVCQAAPGRFTVTHAREAPGCFKIGVDAVIRVVPPSSIFTQTGMQPPIAGRRVPLKTPEVQRFDAVEMESLKFIRFKYDSRIERLVHNFLV